MITLARQELTDQGIIDQFELITADIFEANFALPVQVDCVVMSYTLTTFCYNYDMLSSILKQCCKQCKADGYMLIADFSYVDIPKDEFFFGMQTSVVGSEKPKEFEAFHFIIENAPDHNFYIFNIESWLMFKAGVEAGFNNVTMCVQYPDPEVKDDPIIRRYLYNCNPQD